MARSFGNVATGSPSERTGPQEATTDQKLPPGGAGVATSRRLDGLRDPFPVPRQHGGRVVCRVQRQARRNLAIATGRHLEPEPGSARSPDPTLLAFKRPLQPAKNLPAMRLAVEFVSD